MSRRLIEEVLPLAEINAASAREKSLRHGHISTMHLWWARRPLSMSRAVVFGTLLPLPLDTCELADVLDRLKDAAPFESSSDDTSMRPLREMLTDAYPDGPPKVLDCFAGGGAIPLEALRLGCDATAVDLNPVAHLIERCVLEYPQRFGTQDGIGGNSLARDFVEWADWVHRRAAPALDKAYPSTKRQRPAVYFWARTLPCPNPGCRCEIPLLSSCWLANSGRRQCWLSLEAPRRRGDDRSIDIVIHEGKPPAGVDPARGTTRAGSVSCPACDTSVASAQVHAYGKTGVIGYRMYAVLDINGRQRRYRAPTHQELAGPLTAAVLLAELDDLADGTSALPDEPCDPIGYRNLQNLVYGYTTWRSLFMDRQLWVLASLASAVRDAYAEMINRGMDSERAKAVSTYLGLCVDRIADYNSAFCTWVPTGEFLRDTFPRQAISMAWDITEIDPFGEGAGNWEGAVRWIELAINHCSLASHSPARVVRGNSQRLPFDDATFDAVVVDPPYYFSVMYSDLSDFFYVWLKRSIGFLYPDLFVTPWTPKDEEVIQNRCAPGYARYISAEEFERRLARSLDEIARVVKPEGIVSLVFAHTDVVAWEKLLRALRTAGLVVTTSWPMRSERADRPLAQVKAALGSSVVLVCRVQPARAEGFYDDVVRQLERRIADRLDTFGAMGLVGADYFVSAVGPAFEVFAKYTRVVRLSGDEVDVDELMVLARQAVARHAMGRLLGEASVSDLDSVSLLYLTWRWAYLSAPVPADEAYKLERAFEVDLSTLQGPRGLVAQAGATFSLRSPDERKGVTLGAAPLVIDVLHQACVLWDAGRRKELESLLADTGLGSDRSFWSLAGALAQVLPDGERERTMLLGLTSTQDAISAAAAAAAQPRVEQPSLPLGVDR